MYMGEPHSVAAIFPSCKNLAKPKSAIFKVIFDGAGNDLPQLCCNKIFCNQKIVEWPSIETFILKRTCGFKSRWTIPFAKRAFIAPAEIKKN